MGLFWRVIALARPYRWQFLGATVLALVLAVLAPVRPMLIRITVDDYILPADDGLIGPLLNMTIILIALLLLESFMRYSFIFLTNWLGQTVIRNLRVKVFEHIVNLRLRFFDRTPIGTSTTRTINDVETINDIFSQGIITIVADLLTIFAIIGVMLYQNWQLTLVSLSVFPLLLVATWFFKEGVKKTYHNVRNALARMNAFLQEHISGMKVVQIFGAEEREFGKFRKINEQYRKANIKAIWYYSIFFPVVEILTAAAVGLVVWYGANQAIRELSSIGTLIAFFMYLNMLFRPVRMLADKFNVLQMGLVAADRVFRILDKKDSPPNEGTVRKERLRGDIRFEHVWFGYDDENYVLRDINFEMKQGETLAIVGATGSGKSSTISVLNRFYDIQKGHIYIDGIDQREYELHNLRSHIGLVLQDVFLFSGSIFENITLRNRNMSREEVIEAAKLCGIHEFIMRLPGNYDFNVQERGGTLSMGQRQLIAFVRTLVYNPSILVLDEATSSIDRESEELIQHAIETLVSNRTSIIIAHRLSTIRHANKILVYDKGRIVEQGSHDQLYAMGGHYRKLHDMQFKTEISRSA